MSIDMDYIDVAERITNVRGEAIRQYPDGTFQPADLTRPYSIETIGEQNFIVVVAAFYRTPEDSKPGIGMAYELVPGKTQFTKGSELQNAETSAWGRALVAALAADTKRGIASKQEVRGQNPASDTSVDPVKQARIELSAILKERGIKPAAAEDVFTEAGNGSLFETTDAAAVRALAAHYREMAGEKP